MIEMERQCPHKIVTFQAHPLCQQHAMVCEVECQALHDTVHITQPAEQIKKRYHKIREDLKTEIRKYSDLLRSYFTSENEMIKKIHEDNTKLMEKQFLISFLQQIGIERNTMDKIYSNRMETLKCSEVYSLVRREKFMEEVDWQKMDNIYKQFRKKEIYQFTKPSVEGGDDVNRNRYAGVDIDLVKRERDILSRELEALRAEMIRQESIRSHAEMEKTQRNRARVATLMQKTFNICTVKTRKIKKNHRDPQAEPLPEKQPLEPQQEQQSQQQQQPQQQPPMEQERPVTTEPPKPANLAFTPLSFPGFNFPPAPARLAIDSDDDSSLSDLIELMKRKGHAQK